MRITFSEDPGDFLRPEWTDLALVHGTVVRAAELILGTEGAVWEKVILVS